MARPIMCDNGCGNEATYLVTKTETGEVISLDDPCFAGWVIAMADQLRPGPLEVPAPEAEAAHKAAQEVEAVNHRPRPKRRQDGRQEGSAALTSEASPFPDATPDDI